IRRPGHPKPRRPSRSPARRLGYPNVRVTALGVDGHMDWSGERGFEDIRYETSGAIAKLTIARPEVRNAFRPLTIRELATAFDRARDDAAIGVVILTGEGTEAFSSGGAQRIRGDDGYVGEEGLGRPSSRDRQIQLRRPPQPA